ncbi:MAG TPA: 30S ribosomal protein S16 [Actinomycetota bacterium]|jgi:small subunit ribosomal protein S16|nr:30S ribosomal protein S16 [Actinomycetota bacterium]
MVKIRLMRMGAKKRPFYRVVVADSRSPRDGRFIENIGRYHPLSDPSVIEIDEERALHWLGVGAQPTNSVRVLLDKAGIWEKFSSAPIEKPKAGARTAAARASAAKAAAKAPALAEPPASKAPAAEQPPAPETAPEEAAAEEPSSEQPEEAAPQEEAAADESAEGGSEERDAGS